MQTAKKHTLFTVYLWLVSIISFIWLAIAMMTFSYKLLSNAIITDEEYTANNNREFTKCEEPIYLWTDNTKLRTDTEKDECIKKAKENMLLQRKLNTKETLLSAWLRAIILLIIFPIHFIYFKKHNK